MSIFWSYYYKLLCAIDGDQPSYERLCLRRSRPLHLLLSPQQSHPRWEGHIMSPCGTESSENCHRLRNKSDSSLSSARAGALLCTNTMYSTVRHLPLPFWWWYHQLYHTFFSCSPRNCPTWRPTGQSTELQITPGFTTKKVRRTTLWRHSRLWVPLPFLSALTGCLGRTLSSTTQFHNTFM